MNIEELLQHRPFVRALARRLVRDQSRADDLEQQTWLTAIEKPPVHRGALRAWLHAVVRNLARTQNRAEFRRTKHEGGQAPGEGLPTPGEALVKAEWHQRLIEAGKAYGVYRDETSNYLDARDPLIPRWVLELQNRKRSSKLVLRPLDVRGVEFTARFPSAKSRLDNQG